MNRELTPELFTKPIDDYLRVMTITPEVAIADPATNVERLLACYESAKTAEAELVVTPELSLIGYSTADLVFNAHVRERSVDGLQTLAAATADGPAMAVGLPLADRGVLYNCAALLADGKVMGVVPKSHLPNYNEFYEERWFTSGEAIQNRTIRIGTDDVPFGTDVLFNINGTTVGTEICEDAWATRKPSQQGALQGAQVYVNLSASNELVGKRQYRRDLIKSISADAIMGYAYTSAGPGESTADVIYGGHQLMGEKGTLVAERAPHDQTQDSLVFDFDRAEITRDRINNKTFGKQAAQEQQQRQYRVVDVHVPQPAGQELRRRVDSTPYLPKTPEARNEVYEDMATDLAVAIASRYNESHSEKLVIGLSGGLDSTLTLLLALRAAKRLGLDPSVVQTITMPADASSERTQSNATKLAQAVGTDHQVVPINELNADMLRAIGHDELIQDITYENSQARMRTNILFNTANMKHGILLGTGDMSEIAIGWCTYGGDQLSNFNPNGGIPKTIIKDFVAWLADNDLDPEAREIAYDILDTPISPELTGDGSLSQETESINGPYILGDFFDWHNQRLGERPSKIGYLAMLAFAGMYDGPQIADQLNSFLRRTVTSQHKREAMPNTPKIGSMSKSPRGDLRQAPNTSPTWYR